ncbi:hypothetical protein A2985_01110 [Candidatus Woesebacteria bacterium RIFCSPLOWO2_01_FULL_43_11]|mgnify:CR=1 FL=1|nr:MAG: hypothetical protein A2985_01110 [Candidatus Woesebacteria bacterium RIFCSPLOWO2_01_FULL_43_11]
MARKLAQVILALLTFFLLSPSAALAQTPQFEFLSKSLDVVFDTVVSGNLAYVAAAEHIYILDISNPENPGVVGNFYEPGCVFYRIDLEGTSSFSGQDHFSCSPRKGIYVLDVSEPESIGSQEPLILPSRAAFYEMMVQDGYLYIASGLDGLYILDVRNPSPEIEPTLFKPYPYFYIVDVKVRGNVAYLADNYSKVWTVDVTNKTNPQILDYLDLPSSATGVSVSGDYAYVSLQTYLPTGQGGLQVVNISDPNNISPSALIPLPDPQLVADVEVEGNYAFLIDGNGRLYAYDISIPSQPEFVAAYQMETAGRLTVSGDLILASNVTAGLSIFRFTGLAPGAPAPFLDLPWDYVSKGKTFSEASLAINAYFDHEYPFLSTPSLSEPADKSNSVVTYNGFPRINRPYSSHDGYDYGTYAGAPLGDPVLAAAGGCASYRMTSFGGNTIRIDHGNGYQTRYLHLLADGLVTTSQTCVDVVRGQQIGKVGYTGHVEPEGASGSHIHFMVVQDKNRDGNFDDNIPDGVVDPFGWQSTENDPWESYGFNYGGQDRTGARSYYLWLSAIANLSSQLPSNGGFFELERYSLNFPAGATEQTLKLDIQVSPRVNVSDVLESIGSSIVATARDLLGNIVSSFQDFFTISISFEGFDLNPYDVDTLSIYSSEDGVNWTRENTAVDFDNRTTSTSVNHLSYFTLMAERLDTIPANTEATLEGAEGDSGWFRSDVVMTLNSEDNGGGLGVDYILYKVNDEDWQQYYSPVTFSQDGIYRIEFYSVDKDENIEVIKAVEFSIDKNIPEAKIYYDTGQKKVVIEGVDENQTAVSEGSGEGEMLIKDLAGNSLILVGKSTDDIRLNLYSVSSLIYSDGLQVDANTNKFLVFDNLDQYPQIFRFLQQSWFEEGEEILQILYRPVTNKSTILIKEFGQPIQKEIRDGLVLLQIATNRGNLEIDY